jgi:3-oxoacyl-[acyl-carrier protein] reductase
MRGLKDKVVIVTGAGRGLGRATALRFAEEGAHVCVNDVDERNAETTARMITDTGQKAMISNHDISSFDAAHQMVDQAMASLGDLHFLVNNAGILRDAMLSKITEDQWDAVINVNLKGVFNCTKAAVAAIRSRDNRGSIINLSSVSWMGNIGQTNYSAAKAGVVGLTNTWAMELARFNIRVNAIAPGLIETDMTKQIPKDVMDTMLPKIPHRRLGRPEEIAAMAVFLASEDASYVTGQTISVDGGASLGGM